MIRSGAVGDFVLSLPAIGALRRRFPRAKVEVMGYPSTLELALGRYYADAGRSVDTAGMSSFFRKDGRLDRDISDYFSRFDLIVSYQRDDDGLLERNLRRTGARSVIVWDPIPDRVVAPAQCEKRHAIDHLIDALRPLGIREEGIAPKIFLNPQDRCFASKFLSEEKLRKFRPLVAVHPGCGGKKKMWPPENFASVIEHISRARGAKVVLISGPIDKEAVNDVLNRQSFNPILVKDLSLVQLAALLERCHLFLGNDSGVSHISAAVGTPTLAIFKASDPDIWAPRGENVTTISSYKSQREVSIKEVIEAVETRISGSLLQSCT